MPTRVHPARHDASSCRRNSSPCRDCAWSLTAQLSPRPRVRVADVDAYGGALNTYTGTAAVDGAAPDAPWALYLADDRGDYRLLCFDLDAGKGDAAADAATLSRWLEDAGLQHVVTCSGPSGGRHVWLALAEALPAATTQTLARLALARLTSLDLAPLSNPTTGCVRPPGAPHRHGGTSTVLSGTLASLCAPQARGKDIDTLVAMLQPLTGGGAHGEPVGDVLADRPLPVDAHGRLHLPGAPRQLPAAAATALAEDAAAGDASHVLWRVLVGAAHARWHCHQVADLVAHSPGLEHVRTQRTALGLRQTRTPEQARAVLARHWDRAVAWSAAHPRAIRQEDPTWEHRCAELVELVELVQARADSVAGRWATSAGPAHRRVLDALCTLTLHAVNAAVEADIRRLALLCGIGRETARTALLRLAGEGWITQQHPAQGPHGAIWAIRTAAPTPPATSSTTSTTQDRSQAVTRPSAAGAADRTRWLTLLRSRLAAARHDVFTHGQGGFGHHAGRTYAALTSTPTDQQGLLYGLGYDLDQLQHHLDQLITARLVAHSPAGWTRATTLPRADRRDHAAACLGVDGRLDQRTARYAVERALWAWWASELQWMRATRRTGAQRRPGPDQLSFAVIADPLPHYAAHPRRSGGRADYGAARRELLRATTGDPTRRRRREAAA